MLSRRALSSKSNMPLSEQVDQLSELYHQRTYFTACSLEARLLNILSHKPMSGRSIREEDAQLVVHYVVRNSSIVQAVHQRTCCRWWIAAK